MPELRILECNDFDLDGPTCPNLRELILNHDERSSPNLYREACPRLHTFREQAIQVTIDEVMPTLRKLVCQSFDIPDFGCIPRLKRIELVSSQSKEELRKVYPRIPGRFQWTCRKVKRCLHFGEEPEDGNQYEA